MKLGNGIVKVSERPIKIYVDQQNEIWYCDANVKPDEDFLAAGCSRLSDSPNHK